jgi:plasmid stability protein
MTDLLIRNLRTQPYGDLARAKRRGRSIQAEVRDILAEAALDRHARVIEAMKEIQARFAGRRFSNSAEVIREDRDNDELHR